MKVQDSIHLTMGEAIEHLHRRLPDRYDIESVQASPSSHWDLHTGFETARELAEFGWREKVENVEGYLSTIQNLVQQSWTTFLDVTGECVDVGTYLDGEPECMLSYVVPEETRSVRIVANMSARCSADAPRLLNRGIAIAAAVYALQCTGVPVSLAAAGWVSPSDGWGDTCLHETLVEVNPFGDYIDAGRLAFWLGHPAMLRRCFFRFKEQESVQIRDRYGFKSGSGYGMPQDAPADCAVRREAVYIPFPETDDLDKYQTPEKAFQTIREILSKQGVELTLRK